MKLLFAGIEPPTDIASWSGIPYHLSRSLSRYFDMSFIGDLHGPALSRALFVERIYRKMKWRVYRVRSEPGVLKEFAARLQKKIKDEKPDAVLSVSCEPIAYLKSDVPVYMIHDATFKLLADEYSYFQAMSDRSRKTGEQAQILGFERATFALPASDWARQSVRADYDVPAEKAVVFPMGANLLDPPSAEEVSAAVAQRAASKIIRFLFVGVDWERKGGDTAVSIVQALIARGIDAELHVVGCSPSPSVAAKPFIIAHGFLSKKNPDQALKLRRLFESASFFIVPSIAECYGCVFCEANAFGIPNISRAVGGISEIIRNEKTGFLLSTDYPEERVVEEVSKLCQDPKSYREMATRARADYEERLNWDVYARKLKELIGGTSTQKAGR